jgi:hypothetical protein
MIRNVKIKNILDIIEFLKLMQLDKCIHYLLKFVFKWNLLFFLKVYRSNKMKVWDS